MNRQELQAAFEPLRGRVEKLDQAISQGRHPERLPGYLNEGAVFYVYHLHATPFVVKLPRVPNRDYKPAQAIDLHVSALLEGQDVPDLEKIGSYSPKTPPAVVCRYIPGPLLRKLELRQVNQIPQSHFERLLDTFRAMQGRGLRFEPYGDNVIYNKRLFIIDYDQHPQTFNEKVLGFAEENFLKFVAKGKPLPDVAHTLRAACVKKAGSIVVDQLDALWNRRRLK